MWTYANKLAPAELAARVGLAVSQVNARITRAREKLRRRLEDLSPSPEQRSSIDKGFDTWMFSLRHRVDDSDEHEGPDR